MKPLPLMKPFDTRNIPGQVGCGYCMNELCCSIVKKDRNLALEGCPCYTHWSNTVHFGEPYSDKLVKNFYDTQG